MKRSTFAPLPPLLLAAQLLLGACAGGEDGAGTSTATEGERWEASAVGIEATGCSLVPSVGSGAIVAEPEVVVTTAHTVAGATAITVIDRDDRRHSATLLLVDPDQDIALLSVPGLDRPPLPIGRAGAGDTAARTAWDGQTGFRTDELTVTRELSVTIEDIYIDHEVGRRVVEFEGPVDRGDSGAVLVVDGKAVGLIYAKARTAPDLGYALDHSALQGAVGALDPGGRTPVPSGDCVP